MTNSMKEQVKKAIESTEQRGVNLVDLRKEEYDLECDTISNEGHLLYCGKRKCQVVGITHDYDHADRTLIKLKPDGTNMFYLDIRNIEPDTEKRFIHAWRNNKKIVMSYSFYSN